MRANLVWLLALLCAVALFIGYRFPAQRILSLHLLLATKPIARDDGQILFVEGDCFRLDLDPVADGSAHMSTGGRKDGVMSQDNVTTLSAQDWAALEKGLLALPGWRERQADGGEPQGQALYTELKIETTEGKFVSHWRGLPKPQADVANFLLASKAGGPLRQGLSQLQTRP